MNESGKETPATPRLSRKLAGWLLFLAGLAAGIFVQHRWPLGRWRDEFASRPVPATRTAADVARIPRDRRLVIVVAGQSNAANYGATKQTGGPGVYAFMGGALFAANDPLPGADGYGGSIWTRLGARLRVRSGCEAVVFAVVARGSTRAADWAPGGFCHDRLIATLTDLAAAGLPADGLCWQQGETEAGQPMTSGDDYFATLQDLVSICRKTSPGIEFFVAQATFGETPLINGQISPAQSRAAMLPGALAGPNFDLLGPEYRSDGIHFNDRGLAAAADRWFDALTPWLERGRTGSPP